MQHFKTVSPERRRGLRDQATTGWTMSKVEPPLKVRQCVSLY